MNVLGAAFKEQQRKYGFDTDKIEQLKQVVRGVTSAPCAQPPVQESPARVTTPNARAMLKRGDGSLQAFTGMGYTTIFNLEKAGKFPKRRKLSPGRVGWLVSEVQAWLDNGESVVSI